MKKNIFTFALILISFLSQAQNRFTVDIIDFTTEEAIPSVNINLLSDLKTEFQSQFQSEYIYFNFPTSRNKLVKLKTQGYTDIKVVEETDLAVLVELQTDENNIPNAIKIDILLITDNYEVYSNPVIVKQSDKNEFTLLSSPSPQIVENAVKVIFKNIKFHKIITKVTNDLNEKKKVETEENPLMPHSHEVAIEKILSEQDSIYLEDAHKLMNHVVDYEYKHNKNDLSYTFNVIENDEVWRYLYLEQKYKYFVNLRDKHITTNNQYLKEYQSSTNKQDSIYYLEKMIIEIDRILIFTKTLKILPEKLNNISFADDEYKQKNDDRLAKDNSTFGNYKLSKESMEKKITELKK